MGTKDYENIDDAIRDLERFHDALLFVEGDLTGQIDGGTFAPHFYLTAVGNIEAAINQLKLASLYLARERAGNF